VRGGWAWLAGALLVAPACAARPRAPLTPGVAGPGPPAAPRAPAPPPWLAELAEELTALRGLPFTRPVRFETQTRDAFRAKVRRELARDYPADKARNLSRAYAALGFAGRDFDLSRALEDALTSEVLAYYDPETRAFTVIGGDARAAGQPGAAGVVSHELAHALQDQHFDLRRFEGEQDPGTDEDQRLARRFVVEGEATFLMTARGMGTGGPAERRLGSWSVAGLRLWTRMLAAMDVLDLASSVRQGRTADALDPETRASMETLARLPPLVTVPLFEPYAKGAELISEVWAAGGWPAVDALYRRPPDSTEQVLHPIEKLIARRDPPVRVTMAPGAGWPAPGARLLASEVIGELGWRAYFKTWDLADGDAAAAGWGGDRYWSWAIGARTVTIAATTWDSAAEAAKFFSAYEATLARRYPSAVAAGLDAGGLRLDLPGGTVLALVRKGDDVDVIQGVRENELRAALRLLGGVRRTRPAAVAP
jgi:hypothetical protein